MSRLILIEIVVFFLQNYWEIIDTPSSMIVDNIFVSNVVTRAIIYEISIHDNYKYNREN